jgi:EAL domain-containing protein (putative c-di-GMP-specific phosphodiesterase class I)
MPLESFDRARIENDLRRGLEREMRIAFQPQVRLAGGELTGAEALLRWHHPEHGLVPASQFIGVAEETGLIVQMGRWIIHEACTLAAQWQEVAGDPVRVAVNVSARQLREERLADDVRSALADAGLGNRLLQLEVPHPYVRDGGDAARGALAALRDAGAAIMLDAVDPEGEWTRALEDVPLDAIKLGRELVDALPDEMDAARELVDDVRGLGVALVATGVESQEQLDALRELGCDFVQGYYIARPLSLMAFEAMLRGSGFWD